MQDSLAGQEFLNAKDRRKRAIVREEFTSVDLTIPAPGVRRKVWVLRENGRHQYFWKDEFLTKWVPAPEWTPNQ